jgi:serine/threonine-protein kinase
LRARARRAVRRHPRAAAGAAALTFAVVLAVAAVAAVWRAEARERARTLQTNGFIASGQAGALLFQLRVYGDRVERAARHPVVRALLERGAPVDPAPALAALADGFDGIYLENSEAQVLAQWPSPAQNVFERRYTFRDYFQGARRLAQSGAGGVYVARAFRSESHGRMEFAISTPVLDSDGGQIGMLAASFHAREAFGAVRMHVGADGDKASADAQHITTALLGPRGGDRSDGPDGPTPSRFTFLVHPGLAHGAEHTLETPSPRRLNDAFGPPASPGEQLTMEYVRPLEVGDFRDPIPGFEGRWLAAFAPVGRTGFVVLVETRRPDTFRWSTPLARGIAFPVTGVVAVALLTTGALMVSRRRRRRAPVAHSPR